MKVYGYTKNGNNFVELREASLECNSIEEIDRIIEFLQYSRERHNKVRNDTDWCHSHYRDWDKKWSEDNTDLILISVFGNCK